MVGEGTIICSPIPSKVLLIIIEVLPAEEEPVATDDALIAKSAAIVVAAVAGVLPFMESAEKCSKLRFILGG